MKSVSEAVMLLLEGDFGTEMGRWCQNRVDCRYHSKSVSSAASLVPMASMITRDRPLCLVPRHELTVSSCWVAILTDFILSCVIKMESEKVGSAVMLNRPARPTICRY